MSDIANTAITVRLSDSNNNQRLSHEEVQQSEPLKKLAILALTKEASARTVTIDFPMSLGQKDGSVSKNLTITRTEPFVIDDRPLLPNIPLMEAVTTEYLRQLTKPARFKLPKGAEKIMLSDFCGPDSALPCQVLPKVKGESEFKILVGPKGKTI